LPHRPTPLTDTPRQRRIAHNRRRPTYVPDVCERNSQEKRPGKAVRAANATGRLPSTSTPVSVTAAPMVHSTETAPCLISPAEYPATPEDCPDRILDTPIVTSQRELISASSPPSPPPPTTEAAHRYDAVPGTPPPPPVVKTDSAETASPAATLTATVISMQTMMGLLAQKITENSMPPKAPIPISTGCTRAAPVPHETSPKRPWKPYPAGRPTKNPT
jgi:hypothetical protein